MNAFNARTTTTWKGDKLFRIYPKDGRLYFIKVGGSKVQTQVMFAQFGLLGGLIGYFAAKRQKKKTQEKLNSVAGLSPEELLAMDKLNQVLDISELSEPTLNPRSFWSSSAFGSFSFRNA